MSLTSVGFHIISVVFAYFLNPVCQLLTIDMLFPFGLFCRPEQILSFLTIFGVILGLIVLIVYEKERILSKKILKWPIKKISFISVIIIYLFILGLLPIFFLWGIENIIILFLPIVLIVILYVFNLDKIYTIFTSFLIAFFIAGITGNACLYLPVGMGTIVDVQASGSTISTNDIPSPLQNSCKFDIIGVNKERLGSVTEGDVIISLYSNYTFDTPPSMIFELHPGQDFAFCCHTWNYINTTGSSIYWRWPSRADVFCYYQDWFSMKGAYRPYS